MPNDGWLSFYWSDSFLLRFSLALDFAPYLPGRTRLEEDGEAIALAIDSLCLDSQEEEAAIGEILEVGEASLLVNSRCGVLRCRQLTGGPVAKGLVLLSGRPREQAESCCHPIPWDFDGKELPVERYLLSRASPEPQA
ncbi:unnamed protein product, partial [Symbiodinium pilosum]